MILEKKNISSEASARSIGLFLAFLLSITFTAPCFSQSQTELGSEDDLTVLGTDGTVPDPDMEVKGFTIFGSTNVLTHISTAPGSVVINGALEISSNVYVIGESTFTGQIYLAPPIGERALLGLYSETVGSSLHSSVASNIPDSSLVIAGRRSRGTLEIPSAVLNKDVFLRLTGRGYGSTEFTTFARTWIDFIAAEDWTDTKQGSAIVFNTTLIGGVSQGERMRIDGYGNIGISTRVPQARMDVLAGGSAQTDMAQIWRKSDGVIVGSMSATGVMMATKIVGDGSGLTGVTGATDDTKVLKTGDTMTGQLTIRGSTLTVIAPDTAASSLWVSTSATTPHLYVSTGGNVGVGTNSLKGALTLDFNPLNPTISPDMYSGLYLGALPRFTVSQAGTYAGIHNWVRAHYETGVSDTGWIYNSALRIVRNAVSGDATDNGTLARMTGLSLIYGHRAVGTSNPLTTNVYGIHLAPYVESGTVTNLYDLYLANHVSGGTITNHWAIYQAEPQANNYLAGNVGISTRTPQARLDVLGSGTLATDFTQIWRNSAGTIVSSMSATGVLYPAVPATDDTKVAKTGDTMTGQLTIRGSTLTVIAPDTAPSSLWVSTSATTPHLYVSTNGNVGIGTSAPVALLEIVGNSNDRPLLNIKGRYEVPVGGSRAINIVPKVSGSVNGLGALQTTSVIMPTGNFSTAFGNVFIGMLDEGGGTTVTNFNANYIRGDSSASYTGAIGNLTALNIGPAAYMYGNKPTNSYGLKIENQGTAGITNSYGLYVVPQTGATNSYAAIFAMGNVGLSTGAPQARLDVLAGGSAQTDMAQIWRDGTGTIVSSVSATGVLMASRFVGDGSGLTMVPGTLPGGSSGQTLRHDGSAWVAGSSIYNDGTKVGIATGVPGATLEVNGDILADKWYHTKTAFTHSDAGYPTHNYYVLLAQENTNDKLFGKIYGSRGSDISVPRGALFEVAIDASSANAAAAAMVRHWAVNGTGGAALSKVTYGGNTWWTLRIYPGSGLHAQTYQFEGYRQVTDLADWMRIVRDDDAGLTAVLETRDYRALDNTLVVHRNGNVGIGATTSPNQALTVIGNISQTGVIISSGAGGNYFAGNVSIGANSSAFKTEVYGSGQAVAEITDAGARGNFLALNSAGTVAGSGGALMFGNAQSRNVNSVGWAGIKGSLVSGGGNTIGDLVFLSRANTTDTALTERMRILANGNIGISTNAPQASLDIKAAYSLPSTMAQIWRDSGGVIVSSVSATGVLMASRFVGDGSGLSNISANAGVYTLAQMNALAPAAAGRLISVSDAAAPYSYCVSTGTAAGAWVLLNQVAHCQ